MLNLKCLEDFKDVYYNVLSSIAVNNLWYIKNKLLKVCKLVKIEYYNIIY